MSCQRQRGWKGLSILLQPHMEVKQPSSRIEVAALVCGWFRFDLSCTGTETTGTTCPTMQAVTGTIHVRMRCVAPLQYRPMDMDGTLETANMVPV